jgi:hypothetical protein
MLNSIGLNPRLIYHRLHIVSKIFFLDWHFTFGAVAIFEMTDSLLAALSLYPRQSDADISELKNYVKIVWSKSPATQEIHT